jgi:hypothetical protein
MSADEALRAAYAAGVTVVPDGENLVLEAKAAPPQSVLDALSRHKFAILALMRPIQGGVVRGALARVFREMQRDCRVQPRTPACGGGGAGLGLLRDRVVEPASSPISARTLRMVWQARVAHSCRPAVRDSVGDACMAARRMLAGLAAGAEGRSHCGAAGHKYSDMRQRKCTTS